MKRLLIALLLAMAATAAYAACSTHSVMLPDGRVLICLTCCDSSGNCITNCS